MAETATKLPMAPEAKTPAAAQRLKPFEMLRQEIDRLFDEFRPVGWGAGFDLRVPAMAGKLPLSPAVDLVENEAEYEITAEMPGMDEKDIDLELSGRRLIIKGEKSEKKEQKEQKEKDYYLSERHYGSFQRVFQLPDAVDQDKIEAGFAKGVLTVRLPKVAKAQQSAKKISVKGA